MFAVGMHWYDFFCPDINSDFWDLGIGRYQVPVQYQCLKVHYATFLRACKQTILVQEIVVNMTFRCTLKLYVYICTC